MSISRSIASQLESSSWIRRMFETGQALKQELGPDRVFDLSLGNPILEPPSAFRAALQELVASPPSGLHRYMPNQGFMSTREAVARLMSRQEGCEVQAADITMTVGAAGAINVALRAILDEGDEVLILEPYFVEYFFYTRNHGGRERVVRTTDDFDLDFDAIEAAIGPRTKALILNSPNNPTGRVYSQQRVDALGDLLGRCSRKLGRTLYLLVDTPYARLTYDGVQNPQFFCAYPDTLIAHSFSKELGIPGERLGFLAVSPAATQRRDLQDAAAFANRTLGFVNAPALMQLVVERALETRVDLAMYTSLRDRLCDGLRAAGYSFFCPQGAFYLFPKSPIEDDVAFTAELARVHVLVVPGSGFGRKGHIRIAFCVTPQTIEGALPLLAAANRRAR